ncbi:MAG: DNA repair protein RecO [Verrucomicrobiota bacterium JB022]|nr:DNA repair protein RecO [Verrucomicrobiota bacterium JB022]
MEADRGTIIRLRKLTDSSLIVSWLTEGAGLVRMVAKGARRTRGPFAGKLDLFVEADVQWARARRGDLHYLREVAVRDYRLPLRNRYRATLVASYFGFLVEEMVEEDFPVPEVADLLGRALDFLQEKDAGMKELLFFESELAKIAGSDGFKAQEVKDLGEKSGFRARCVKMLAE